jgi:hypothetical protein
MAKSKKEELPEGPSPAPKEDAATSPESGEAVPVVPVLYSRHRDVYKLPALGINLWLEVEVHFAEYGMPEGQAITADGKGWRHVHTTWTNDMQHGDSAAIPATDPLTMDYTLAERVLARSEQTGLRVADSGA